MKSQKCMEKYILPVELTNKVLENDLRIFETGLTRPQLKSLKTVIRGLWKNSTTIISHIHEHTIETKKFIEKTSKHLGNMDIIKTIEKKAKRCIMKSIKERDENNERTIIAYDETDIFKPDAKCMPGLMRIRDGSTVLAGNGYVVRGVNVNGVSLYSHLEEALDGKLGKQKEAQAITVHLTATICSLHILFVPHNIRCNHSQLWNIKMLRIISFVCLWKFYLSVVTTKNMLRKNEGLILCV